MSSTSGSPAVRAGQVWRNDPSGRFFLVTEDGGNYCVPAFEVAPHPEHGHWVPAGDGHAQDLPEAWLLRYARPFDHVERWLTDGGRLLSVDPNRHFEPPRRP